MIILEKHEKRNICAAIFDFDGTLSTLRAGWENVMAPMMEEYLPGQKQKILEFIDASTGIQTVLQMKWLREEVIKTGKEPLDIWEYKAEYNRRLMESVMKKREEARQDPEKYLMTGAREFLEALKERGIRLYAASGTDDADVLEEAKCLGLDGYFDIIRGAMPFSESCSKEATLKELIAKNKGEELIQIGDGPVEIRLGRASGGLTLGIAGNECDRRGFDEAKVKRLTGAGAHALVDCFMEKDTILKWMED